MLQQVKAFFYINRKRLQAGTLSFVLGFVMLLSLLSLLSWPTGIAQAESKRPLIERDVAAELIQKESRLDLSPFLQTANNFEAMDIDWNNYSIKDQSNNYFNYVVAMTIDLNEQVWFGGFVPGSPGHGRLAWLDADEGMQQFSFPGSDEKNVEELVFDGSGDLWVATNRMGLSAGGADRWHQSDNSWQHYDIGNNDIRTMAVDGEHIWFGTYESGVYRFTPSSGTWITYTTTISPGLCSDTIHKITVGDNGDIWFGTENGLCKLDVGLQWTPYLTGTQVSDIAFDNEGGIWVTRPGADVSFLSPQDTWTHFTSPFLTSNLASTIFVDSVGRKWIGYQGQGIDILSPDNTQVRNLSTLDDLSDDVIYDIIEDPDGNIWVGHNASLEVAVVSQGTTQISGLTATADDSIAVNATAILTATIEYGSGVSYTWGFGDDTPEATGITVTHAYQAAGSYTAVVTASNSLDQVTATTTVLVGEPIIGLTAANNSPTQINNTTLFTAAVTAGEPVSYSWDFGDSSPTTVGAYQSHVYSDTGYYTTTVTATNPISTVTTTTNVTVTDAPIALPDVVVQKTGPDNVPAGSPIIYDISVANQGSEPATNVRVTDTLPIELDYVDSSGNSVYDANTHIVIWDFPFIDSGVTETLSLQTEMSREVSVPSVTNWITGTLAEEDANPLNNQASFTTIIDPPIPGPDLKVYKSGSAQVPTGFLADYTITIVNQGGQSAPSVTVTDTLPLSLTLVSSSIGNEAPWNESYDADSGTIVWKLGNLAPGASYKITMTAQVAEDATTGDVVNQALATMRGDEADVSNNQAVAVTKIIAAAPRLTIAPATNGSDPASLWIPSGSNSSIVVTATNSGTAVLLGGLTVTDLDYTGWLTITPPTIVNDIGIGQSVTFTISANPPARTALYYDRIYFESQGDPRVPSEAFYLEIYAHPQLVDVPVQITNNMGDDVNDAGVFFTKQVMRPVFLEGVEQPNHPYTTFTQYRTTNSNGEAVLTQMEVGNYSYNISADRHEDSPGTYEIVNVGVFSAELTALPGLVFQPDKAIISVVAGQPAHFTFQLRNEGPGNATNFSVQTPDDLSWLSSGLPEGYYGLNSTKTLNRGEAMSVTLFLNPPLTATNMTYQEYIVVNATGVSEASLAATINVISDTVGSLAFTIVDQNGSPIENAQVVATNQTGREVAGSQELMFDQASGDTNATGQVTLSGLPPAEYNYFIEADGYYLETGSATVTPDDVGIAQVYGPFERGHVGKNVPAQTGSTQTGGNNQVTVEMTSDPFTYSWEVIKTNDIIDTYAITVAITYEADAVDPTLYVNSAMFCPGQGVGFIVANMGPITMTNVVLNPAHDGVSFMPDPTESVTLAPGEAITGTFSTSGDRDDAANSGRFHVTAKYTTPAGTFDYETSGKTVKLCPSGGGGGWSWRKVGGHVEGTYTGSHPSFPKPIPVASNRERAQLVLSGEATLERQAFTAKLHMESIITDTVIEDIKIDIEARNEDGWAVVDGFAVIPAVPTELGDLGPGNSLDQEWILVPGNLQITETQGAVYNIRAQIVYTYNNISYTIQTLPQPITVYPQPYVQLNFSHTQPDENGDFLVEISAQNDGYGTAKNLNLDLSEVTALDDLDGNGRSLIFELKETKITGQSSPPLEYVFRFGNLQPGESVTGTWKIGVYANDGKLLDNQVVTGFDVVCNHLPYQGVELSTLLNCGVVIQPYLTDDCPFCGSDGFAQKGGPINTGNGNYDYQQGTPAIPTVGNPLQFVWTYNSLNSGVDPAFPVFSSTLGVGWTHNYQLALDLSGLESPHKTIALRAPHGTPIYFRQVRDGYEPVPGAHATMAIEEFAPEQFVYTVTTGSQATFVFTNTGQLLRKYDARGNVLNLNYNPLGQLERVEEPVSGRYLDFGYDAQGQLTSVTDLVNRSTQFGYNLLGHLTVVTDTRGLAWPYGYTQLDNGHYLLSRIEDPDGRLIEETGFDEFGRAITQTYRGRAIAISYFDDGRREITEGSDYKTFHIYNKQGLLVAATDASRELERYVLDGNNNRVYEEDRNGNPTFYEKTAFGYTNIVTDSLGNGLYLEYDDFNNWTSREDARGRMTFYDYDGQGNLVTQTNHYGGETNYTYNEHGQQTSITDENKLTTEFGYDAIGQTVVITNAQGLTSTFEYDGVGRLITTTDVMGKMTVNQYDPGNNLVQVTENARPGYPQNYQDEYNLVTQFGFNKTGQQTTVTDTLGMVNLTLFDEAGRVVTQVVNYDGTTPFNTLCTNFTDPDPEANVCSLTTYDELGRVVASTNSQGIVNRTIYDNQGRLAGTVDNWQGGILTAAQLPGCLALPENRDYDVCTLFGYDAAGNGIVMTDTVGQMTRTYYDGLNRVEGMIMNWDGTTTLDTCLSLPRLRDDNVCMWFEYDEVGNTTVMTDTLGQRTRTFYDLEGRTIATVANWKPSLTTPDQCVLSPGNTNEENICSLTEYDEKTGNPLTTTNALGQKTLAVYDEYNRPYIQVANWDGTPIDGVTDCQFPPDKPDTNLCSVTLFDQYGRVYASRNPLGNEVEMAYDSLGRVVTTTRLFEGMSISTTVTYNALGHRLTQTNARGHTTEFFYDSLYRPLATESPEGVVITSTYNVVGQVLTSTNNLGHATGMRYDDLGRLVYTINAEQNETQYEYDVLGNQVAVIDANDVRTSYQYDALRRLETVIENDTSGSQTDDSNIATHYTYDVLGSQISIVNGRDITVSTVGYDGLYRPTVITDALGHTSSSQYNALGMKLSTTDANGDVTSYGYDGLNRPITVTYETDGETVLYAYNALGSRIMMTDSLGTTHYQYDDLSRLETVTDPFNASVGYGYDVNGNRTQLTYPGGKVVTYTYDADGRLGQVEDWNHESTSYSFDEIGRLITTTLPNGVVSVNQYDDANRLLRLSHTAADDSLLADYQYEVDGMGNRQAVTETLQYQRTTSIPSGTNSLSGHVWWDYYGDYEPLNGALVSLLDSSGLLISQTMASAGFSASFGFSNLADGVYTVTACGKNGNQSMYGTRTYTLANNAVQYASIEARSIPCPTTPPLASTSSGLFISEYVEGSGNNKAIELYNPSGLPIDFSTSLYDIQIYFNGNTDPGRTITLTGTIPAGGVYVIAHGSVSSGIKTVANQLSSGNWFNGDDVVVLRHNGAILDVIGQIGFDPGSEWGNGDTSTENNTMRRYEAYCHGDGDGADPFVPITEWVGYSEDSFGDLGVYC